MEHGGEDTSINGAGSKPQSFQGDLHHLPSELAPLVALPNWVLWRWEQTKDGKWTKPPYQPNGYHAKNNDPKTWSSYDTVIAALTTGKYDGIGFCLLDGNIVAFDIDNCRGPHTGLIYSWALELVDRANSYAEFTPSGTGLRIIGTGDGPKLHRKLRVHNGVSVEPYRKADRYITITGNPLSAEPRPFANIDVHLDAVLAELETKKADGEEARPGTPDDGGHPAPNVPTPLAAQNEARPSLRLNRG
jgi:primase-polymerase (primpol)-like protein